MSMNFRSQNTLTLAKVETTIGVDAAPVAATNAMRAEPGDWAAKFDTEQLNFASGSISQSPPIVGGGMAQLGLKTRMMGSASAGTTAPDVGTLLRGCAMSQLLTAADVTGTAQAGAAGSLTIAAGASAVDNAYRGMVLETTSGTGSGQRRVIQSYIGSSKIAAIYPNFTVTPDATTVYAIRKSAQYQPITVGQEALTLYSYLRNSASGGLARLRKVTGAMGGWDVAISAQKTAALNFSFQGLLPAAPGDVTDPGAGTYVGVDPKPYINALTYLGGVPVKFNDYTLSSGNKPSSFADPAQLFGNDTTEIVDRVMTGKITVAQSMVATMDAVSDWVGSVSKPLWHCWGPVGQGVSIFLPAIRYTGNEPADAEGFAVEGLPFQATGSDLECIVNFF